ncbi:hypothetical protein [Bartonella sp. cb54]|uniref:hypothetical protein n=1 Tax=Bartonella sp. cb54 TaxID=3385560 RepID=UPI0039A76C66
MDLLNQVRVAGYTKIGLMGLQTSFNVLTAKEEAGSVAESTIGGCGRHSGWCYGACSRECVSQVWWMMLQHIQHRVRMHSR